MTPDRTLINKALWLFRPDSTEGRTVLDLVAALEVAIARKSERIDDEVAIRAEIDDCMVTPLLVWADLLEERGEQAVSEGMRWLARNGKWPGSIAGLYRWSTQKPEFGAASSWTLPERAVWSISRAYQGGRFKLASDAMLAGAQAMADHLQREENQRQAQEVAAPKLTAKIEYGDAADCPRCGRVWAQFDVCPGCRQMLDPDDFAAALPQQSQDQEI